MKPFTRLTRIDGGERKALIFAVVFSGLFIVLLSTLRLPRVRKIHRSSNNLTMPAPLAPSKLLELEDPPPPFADLNQKYRIAPESFRNVDFTNYSYGLYPLPDGRNLDLTLYNSEVQLPNDSGWFSLRDVYYKDVTGDGKAEAIVRLWHVQCGASCDGGADLFYIYTEQKGKLKNIWQYETGSYGYGCGLKALTIVGTRLVFEFFGHCPKPATDDPSSTSKFVVNDLTYVVYEFDGRRFKRDDTEFHRTPPTNVKNYEPQIRIY